MGAVPRVALIAVGDEIIDGRIVDTNSAEIAGRLESHGLRVAWHLAVGDAEGDLARALRERGDSTDALVIAGGLGPTEDDRTRAEVANALGVPLEFRSDAWRGIEALFASRGLRAASSNRRQAHFPAGAVVLENSIGTAPGFFIERTSRGGWWVLPGVPSELRRLFSERVLPELVGRLSPTPPPSAETWRFFGVSESVLDEWLTRWITQNAGTDSLLDYHIRVSEGEIEVRLPPGLPLGSAGAEAFGARCLGTGPESLVERLVPEALRRARTIATAESCTGGALGARITDVPGSSGAYLGGWVVYSNAAKEAQLGVPADLLADHGAVSAPVACALARGARARSGADLAVSITGIAGPGGGSPAKPPGTTFLALSDPGGTRWRRVRIGGDRTHVRALAVKHALFALWCRVRDADPEGWNLESPADSLKP